MSTAASPHTLADVIEMIVLALEVAGIAVIVVGALVATAIFTRDSLRESRHVRAFHDYRGNLGRAILLGLEFLVAADIVATVALEPTFRGLGVLAGLVLIRTFLSFALEVEIEGQWPWQRGGEARETASPNG